MAKYRHDWDIGEFGRGVSAASAMKVLQSRPNDIFPFVVKGQQDENDIQLDHVYSLINTTGPFDNLWTGADVVKVSELEVLSFTFATLAAHHRGADQTISFEIYEAFPIESKLRSNMHVYLAQYGTYICSWDRPFSAAKNILFNGGAIVAWAMQAHNLRVALGTLGKCETNLMSNKHQIF